MNHYIVLYRVESIMSPLDEPFAFNCQAENLEHAEEQCLNAEPDADIVWVYGGRPANRGDSVEMIRELASEAYEDYYQAWLINNPEE